MSEQTSYEKSGNSTAVPGGAFGPNAWLVDDMYDDYRRDPQSVSESWREFFQDYRPGGANLARPSVPETTVPPEPSGPSGSPGLSGRDGAPAAVPAASTTGAAPA